MSCVSWRRLSSLAGLLILLGPASRVFAREQQPASPELLLFEQTPVTSATKHAQSPEQAPAAVTVVTRQEIQRFGYRTLAEALRGVRGFYGSYDRNYSYIGVRGFLRPGDYNDRILLLVNGHTYNDDIYQTAYLGPEFGIDLESIDHIEVIRGPGSALYGGNALFAVINVVTVDASVVPGVRALVETGSFGRKRGQMSAAHVFANGLDLYTSGSVTDIDGHENLFYPEFDSPETNHGVAHDVDGERALNYFVSARYGGFFLQGGVNRRTKDIPTGSFETTFNDPDTKTTDGRQFAEVLYANELRPGFDLTGRAFYDGVYYSGAYIQGSGAERVKNIDLGPSHWLGGELRARWAAFATDTVTGGVEFTYHPDATQQNFDRGGERFLDDHRSFDSWGVYAQNEWELLRNLTLVTGLRFDSYYDRLREVSPRFAAVWSPAEATRVKLLFGRAFRPPNLFEQFYTASSGFAQLPNPGLASEKIMTYEAVLEQELPRGARGVVALYRYDIDGLIDQQIVGSGDDRKLQYQNLDSVTAHGAEFELRVPLPRSLEGRASYAVQEASAGGRQLSNSPKHLANAGLLFPLPAGAEGALELQIVGPRRTLQGRTLDTVTLVNLNLRSPLVRGFRFSGGVYNLLDQRYFDPGGTEHLQDRLRQDGLTFRVQLEYAF